MAFLKFLKGDYAKLNNTAVAEGQILICNDTCEMFVDVAADKRIKIGDFITVANIEALEALDATAVPTSRLYYVEEGNILARSNGTTWVQVNKQPTPEELKALLGLGSAAYTDATDYDAAGAAEAVRAYVGEIPDGYTEETIVAYINKKAEETLNAASGGSSESAASVLAALNTYKAENDPRVQANTDAIDAIEADYLKAADKTELSDAIVAEKERAEGVEGGFDTRIKAIEDDYLKAADKEALQTQINTIMNNPDAEGAINSINEFTKYVEDHGTIADGFRADIDKNKEDIAANTAAIEANAKAIADQATSDAATYETKQDATNKLTEAKGYAEEKATAAQAAAEATAADALASAKTELEGKITDGDAATLASAKEDTAAKVKELADGAVATNTANIAALFEQLTWGSFAE